MISIQILSRKGNDSRGTVIREEDEDIICTSRLQHPLSALALHKGLVSLQDSLKHFGSYMRLRVINLQSGVDIHSRVFIGGLVVSSHSVLTTPTLTFLRQFLYDL
jgi:hypothetical protein